MPLNPPTAAQLRGARKQLRRRPPAIPADLTMGRLPAPTVAARRRVRDLYPSLADVPNFVLEAAARLDPPRGRCRWDLARLVARVRRQRLPITQETRYLLGPMCPGCRAALLPKPKPAPRRRARPRATGRRRLVVDVAALVAAAAGAPSPGITPELAAENAATCRRLGIDPARAAHLTRPTAPAGRR
jgi:hypothetical protein